MVNQKDLLLLNLAKNLHSIKHFNLIILNNSVEILMLNNPKENLREMMEDSKDKVIPTPRVDSRMIEINNMEVPRY